MSVCMSRFAYFFILAGGKIILEGGKIILAEQVGKLFWQVWSPPNNPIQSERWLDQDKSVGEALQQSMS